MRLEWTLAYNAYVARGNVLRGASHAGVCNTKGRSSRFAPESPAHYVTDRRRLLSYPTILARKFGIPDAVRTLRKQIVKRRPTAD